LSTLKITPATQYSYSQRSITINKIIHCNCITFWEIVKNIIIESTFIAQLNDRYDITLKLLGFSTVNDSHAYVHILLLNYSSEVSLFRVQNYRYTHTPPPEIKSNFVDIRYDFPRIRVRCIYYIYIYNRNAAIAFVDSI